MSPHDECLPKVLPIAEHFPGQMSVGIQLDKNSVKDVARVMGLQELGDRITRLIPSGPKVTLQGSLDGVKELNDLYKESAQARELIDQALALEGAVRGTGVHAAGVIIANEPLDHFVVCQERGDYRGCAYCISGSGFRNSKRNKKEE